MRELGIRSIGRILCIIIVFGAVQFFLLTFAAAFVYPGGFDYFGYFFSDLGAVIAKNGELNYVSSALFSIALVVVAVALIPFWLIIRAPFTKSKREKVLSIFGSSFGLISFPFLIGVAISPIDTQLDTHIIMTLIFFSLFVLATLLYSVVIILNQDYPKYSAIVGFVLFGVSAIILVDPLLHMWLFFRLSFFMAILLGF